MSLYKKVIERYIVSRSSRGCCCSKKKVYLFCLVFFTLWWSPSFHAEMYYILVWPELGFPFSEMLQGQEEFLNLQCPDTNCFVTSNRTFFSDIRKFDVVVFLGKLMTKYDLPEDRAQHQIYIFFNMESSPNYPVENKVFDGFFNWTATYRLDSDIPFPYMLIRDQFGEIVGPKLDMDWVPEEEVDMEIIPHGILKHKTRAAAIYYSNCRSLSDREQLIRELRKELRSFGLTVDVYGACGSYKCERSVADRCNDKLRTKYYFYLSYENSMDVDYVTEKILAPLQYNVVPIVYGGANYSRFLPPGSYLDATECSTFKLAKTMADLMTSPKKYLQYFWWKKYYTYHDSTLENICSFCTAINNHVWTEPKMYKNFRQWWNLYGYDNKVK